MSTLKIFLNEKEQHAQVMDRFLVEYCNKKNCKKNCLGCHEGEIMRRLPQLLSNGKWNYIPKLCNKIENCPKGKTCTHAHTKEEISFHPLVYKLQLCQYDNSPKSHCSNGNFCSFAHGESDMRSRKLISSEFKVETYKTSECPSHCTEPDCIFFHNPQDRRRNPEKLSYSSSPCANSFNSVSNQCPNKDKCSFSHNSIEVDYHPQRYQKFICKNNECKVPFCSFIHIKNIESKGKSEEISLVVEKQEIEIVENFVKEEIIEDEKGKEVDDEINLKKELKSDEKFERVGGSVSSLKSESEDEYNCSISNKPIEVEDKDRIPERYLCKKCMKGHSTWVLGCGLPVCSNCISGPCVCGETHLTRFVPPLAK